MTLSYKNQNESVKEFRVWAKQNGYFTLNDITKINNYCSEGFDYLIV